MNLQITEAAAKRTLELISQNEQDILALRVAVNPGGCSGFQYDYKLVDKIENDDFILSSFGVKVVIDPVSQRMLAGCTIEFIQELGNSYFQINNPSSKYSCGCGNSFS